MTDGYYILDDGDQKGPFTFNELVEMAPDIHTRILSPDTNTWQDACDLPELNPYFESLGIYFPTEDNLASFGWRLAAFLIDSFIFIFMMGFVMTFLSSNGIIYNIYKIQSAEDILKLPPGQLLKVELIVYCAFIIYNLIGEISPLKGSIGKRAFKMVVVDADGVSLNFRSSLIRSLGKAVSFFFWGIGFLSVIWTEHRQALHDYIAKSYVVKRD